LRGSIFSSALPKSSEGQWMLDQETMNSAIFVEPLDGRVELVLRGACREVTFSTRSPRRHKLHASSDVTALADLRRRESWRAETTPIRRSAAARAVT
jgi:hypothetical protein